MENGDVAVDNGGGRGDTMSMNSADMLSICSDGASNSAEVVGGDGDAVDAVVDDDGDGASGAGGSGDDVRERVVDPSRLGSPSLTFSEVGFLLVCCRLLCAAYLHSLFVNNCLRVE